VGARRQPAWMHPLFVAQDGQRPLAENPVGARKPDEEREPHRQEQALPKDQWVQAPGQIEDMAQHRPG